MPGLVVAAGLALATAAHADDAGEHTALRDVLGEASAIVRGAAIDTTRSGAFADTRFVVADTLRGEIDSDTIVVRQPADGEEPLGRGDDVILLLDRKTTDGVYPLHHPAGRYRVDGDDVVVNASGVDGATLSAKDLRPRAPDERVPLDRFRVLAGGSARIETAPALVSPPPPTTHAAPADARPAPPAQDGSPTRWPWIVGAVAAAALLLYGALRAR
jgi:hypothetical protein